MGRQNKSISTRHLNSTLIDTSTTFFFLLYVTSLQHEQKLPGINFFQFNNHKKLDKR